MTEGKGKASLSINFEFVPRSADPEAEDERNSWEQFAKLSNEWTKVAISFFEVFPFITNFGMAYAKRAVDTELVEFLDEQAVAKEVTQEDDETISSFLIHEDDLAMVSKLLGVSSRTIEAARIVRRSSIGSLVTEYEILVSKVLAVLADIRPSVFTNPESSISVQRLLDATSLDELKSSIVEKKISGLIQEKSHLEVLGWIGEKFNINLNSDKKLLSEFVEITQRRHLIVHNGGIVNERYIELCVKNGCDPSTMPKIGEQLDVTPKYLRRATARIYQVGIFTLHLLWQKLLPETQKASHEALLSISHDFLDQDLTKMCTRICNFAEFGNGPKSQKLKTYFAINRCLAINFDKELDEETQRGKVEEILSSCDLSETSALVNLALACVRREFDNIIELANKAAADGLDYSETRTWCVFKEARDIPGFLECFPKKPLALPEPSDAAVAGV